MNKLLTIQKRNNLNEVFASPIVGPGGAHHTYHIDMPEGNLAIIKFQNGPRNAEGSIPGVLDTDLLEIVRDRLRCFQNGDYSCRENALALTCIEEALLWMNKRVEDRAERNVLGTTKI